MNYRTVAAIGAACIALAGCASVVKGSSQAMSVTTPPTDGANCTLSNSRGSWTLTSPGTATVMRSKSNMEIRCSKAGYADASVTVGSGFEAWTLGNIIFGGLIGIGIDWGTGAIQKYPESVQVPMTPSGGAPTSSLSEPSNPGSGAGM
jgi:hypothetical protein